jgi:hypothetical protein
MALCGDSVTALILLILGLAVAGAYLYIAVTRMH